MSQELRRSLPAFSASVPVVIVYFAVLGIVLAAAGPHGLELSAHQTSGWIAILYGWPTVLAIVLTLRYRQPLLLTGNIFAIIFFVTLGHRVSFPELAGATIVAGAILFVMAVFGLTRLVAEWIPASIVQGLIAGVVLPFVVNVFTALSTSKDGAPLPLDVPLMVGAALVVYLLSQRFLGTRIPPILPSFIAALLVAALTGQLGEFPSSFSPPGLDLIGPEFSWTAIATTTPVLVALLTVPATIPSVIFMRSQGFDPPERLVNVVSGVGTMAGSLFGPVAVSLALPPVLLTAGPGAGERSLRYRSTFPPFVAALGIALFASTAADLAFLVPSVLLLSMAGLALLGALTAAVKEIAAGPLTLGPLFAFAVALSDMTVLGLGAVFWSLVIGTGVSLLVEREGLAALRRQMVASEER
jgi:benzoate membrane transport protein